MISFIKTIVYDYNGTVFDDARIVCHCDSLLIEKLGYPPITFEQFQRHYDWPIDKLFLGVGVSEPDIAKIHSIMHLFHENYESMASKTSLRDGVQDLLAHAYANNVNQLILSNHLTASIQRQLDRTGTSHYITEILSNKDQAQQLSEETKGERLHRYLAKHNLNPEDTVIVGDSPEERHIARQFGLIGIAVTGGFVSEERLAASHPDHLLSSMSELKPVLQARGFFP